jgi:mycothiol synthase
MADTFGGVHPQWRGRGIGRDLFAWQLARLTEIHDALAPDGSSADGSSADGSSADGSSADGSSADGSSAGWEVHVGTNLNNDSGRALFLRFGLTPVRYFFEMSAPTTATTTRELPGLHVVPYTDGMLSAIFVAHQAAFADHWGHEKEELADWVPSHVGSETFRADLSRIAFDGDAIAGYLLAYDGVDNKLYIGQIGTGRAWRKRGIASALIATALAAGAADGKAIALLAVDADSPTGAVGVYERIGFVTTTRFVVFRRPLAG